MPKYHNLYNQLSTTKNNSNDVPDEDTTNMTESSAMAAGNLVAHPKLPKHPKTPISPKHSRDA